MDESGAVARLSGYGVAWLIMDDRDQGKTRVTDVGKAVQAGREAQRAEALRANLMRRKTQARGRADGMDDVAKKPGEA
jgi:hypothetical protein